MELNRIEKEIEKQINDLKSRNITPKLILMGDMAHYVLKMSNNTKLKKFDNVGQKFTHYNDLEVFKKPSFAQGGAGFADEETQYFIQVLGV